MKPCTKCGETKPLNSFPKHKRAKDGRDSWCKACANSAAKAYREANIEKVRATNRRIASEGRKDPDRVAYIKRWHQENKQARSAHRKKWRDANYNKAREIEKVAFEKKRDANLERKRRYAKANRAIYTAYSQKRRAALLQAIPGWADFDKIDAIFKECSEITELLGFQHHVDHIVPLISPVVCGLHVETNLRIIDHVTNRSKGNKHIFTGENT